MSALKKLILVVFVTVLFGCNDTKSSSISVPAHTAQAFFDALYNKKDLTEVMKYATSDYRHKLSRYQTPRHLARQHLHLPFDSVIVDTELEQRKIRREKNNVTEIEVLLIGKRQGKIFKEIKLVKLIKSGFGWLVDDIKSV